MPIIPHGQIPHKIRDVLLATLADVSNDASQWNGVGYEVVIVSPWVRDVPLPVIGSSPFTTEIPTHFTPSDNQLSGVLSCLVKAGARIRLVTLPAKQFKTDLGKTSQELMIEAPLLSRLKEQGCQIETLKGIHAKIVATQNGSVIGSANLTYRGMYKSRELGFLLIAHPTDINNIGLAKLLPDLLAGSKEWYPPSVGTPVPKMQY